MDFLKNRSANPLNKMKKWEDPLDKACQVFKAVFLRIGNGHSVIVRAGHE